MKNFSIYIVMVMVLLLTSCYSTKYSGLYPDDIYYSKKDKPHIANEYKEELREKNPVSQEDVKEVFDEENVSIIDNSDQPDAPKNYAIITAYNDTIYTDSIIYKQKGGYVGDFYGSYSDFDFTEKIRKFKSPSFGYTQHGNVSDAYMYINDPNWNVYIDEERNYAWWAPSWTNPIYDDFRWNSYGRYYGYNYPYYNNFYGYPYYYSSWNYGYSSFYWEYPFGMSPYGYGDFHYPYNISQSSNHTTYNGIRSYQMNSEQNSRTSSMYSKTSSSKKKYYGLRGNTQTNSSNYSNSNRSSYNPSNSSKSDRSSYNRSNSSNSNRSSYNRSNNSNSNRSSYNPSNSSKSDRSSYNRSNSSNSDRSSYNRSNSSNSDRSSYNRSNSSNSGTSNGSRYQRNSSYQNSTNSPRQSNYNSGGSRTNQMYRRK